MVFKENSKDDGRIGQRKDLFEVMCLTPEQTTKNNFLIKFAENSGGANSFFLSIPHSYTRSITREELAERLSAIYKKTNSVVLNFEETFMNLVKLEMLLGILPKKNLGVLVSTCWNESPPILYLETTPKKRLFLQKSKSCKRIEVIEAPQPGREEEARQKFLGKAVMKGQWSGNLWETPIREDER